MQGRGDYVLVSCCHGRVAWEFEELCDQCGAGECETMQRRLHPQRWIVGPQLDDEQWTKILAQPAMILTGGHMDRDRGHVYKFGDGMAPDATWGGAGSPEAAWIATEQLRAAWISKLYVEQLHAQNRVHFGSRYPG